MTNVQTKAECEQAATWLSLDSIIAHESQDSDRPYGCIYSSNRLDQDNRLIWNTPANTSADCASRDGLFTFDCICLNSSKYNF